MLGGCWERCQANWENASAIHQSRYHMASHDMTMKKSAQLVTGCLLQPLFKAHHVFLWSRWCLGCSWESDHGGHCCRSQQFSQWWLKSPLGAYKWTGIISMQKWLNIANLGHVSMDWRTHLQEKQNSMAMFYLPFNSGNGASSFSHSSFSQTYWWYDYKIGINPLDGYFSSPQKDSEIRNLEHPGTSWNILEHPGAKRSKSRNIYILASWNNFSISLFFPTISTLSWPRSQGESALRPPRCAAWLCLGRSETADDNHFHVLICIYI